ncbi:MAG: endonuclease/exonuclease/phosphatase family protein [Opitutaceae bacterium]|nr:endonuclease/exonuclease/phosphatase family protein [Verrucomicrobiales bacterium]
MKDFLHLKIRPWGLILAVGTVAGGITAASYLGAWWWVFEVASNYHLQCGVVLGVASVVCFAGRKRLPGLLFLLLAAVNGIEIYPLYKAATPVVVRQGAPKLRCVLLNLKGANIATGSIPDYIRATRADVVVVTAVDDAWQQVVQSMSGDYPNIITAPREDGYGVGLLSRLPMRSGQSFNAGEPLVPTVYGILTCGDRKIVVLGTRFLPPAGSGDHRTRIEQMKRIADGFSDPAERLILLGDLNVTHWSPYFKEFTKVVRLVDSARGFGIQPTWPVNGFPMQIPIDHCLVSPCFKVLNRTLGPNIGSDHFPLIVDLEVID